MGRSGIAVVGLVLAATTLSACGAADTAESSPGDVDGVCTAERAGGSAVVSTFIAPQGLDPLGQPGNAATGGSEVTALFDTLVGWDPKKAAYVPRVAASFEPNKDFSQWTVKLRPDVKFGNGDPLDAKAVVASIDRHRSAENTQVSRGEAENIGRMQIVDNLTVKFVTTSAYPDFPHVLATDVGMITNPAVVKERGADKFALDPSGAGVGPYELERYSPGEEVVLKAKDDYWGGPVCIKKLTFISVAGGQETFDTLKQGEVDIAFSREPQVIAQARDEGFGTVSTVINYGEGLAMNSAAGATQSVTVRRAVVAALDPEGINKRVWNGTARASSALVVEGTDGIEATDASGHDSDLAAELVAQAKTEGWDGKIKLLSDNAPTRVQTAIAVEAQLEAAGFDVDLDNGMSLSDVITKVAVDRDYDLVTWGAQIYGEGTWAIMNRLLDSKSDSYYGYKNKDVDTLLANLKQATTNEERSEIMGEFQEIFDEDPFYASLTAIEETWMSSQRVNGLVADRGSNIRFDQAFVTG